MKKSEKLLKGFCIAFTVIAMIFAGGTYGFRGYLIMVLALAAFGGWCQMDANEHEREAVEEAILVATENTAREIMRMMGVENVDELDIKVMVRENSAEELAE